MAKVAILYIATGRYIVFWEHFYRSAEKFLLPKSDKNYFVFTDSPHILGEEHSNVTRIEQKKLGWPYDTLMRFDIFLSIRETLEKFDYIYFFNGNSELLSEVNETEFLPCEDNYNLVFTHQPHMFHLPKRRFTYDRNPESCAYIPQGDGKYYFTGALNGGKAKYYLEMCEKLSQNTHTDLEKNIIARWHDESHLNRYAIGRTDIKILPPYFTRSETEKWKTSAKIMFSDKTHYRFGGHAYLRGESEYKITPTEWEEKYKNKKRRFSFRIKQYIKSWFL